MQWFIKVLWVDWDRVKSTNSIIHGECSFRYAPEDTFQPISSDLSMELSAWWDFCRRLQSQGTIFQDHQVFREAVQENYDSISDPGEARAVLIIMDHMGQNTP